MLAMISPCSPLSQRTDMEIAAYGDEEDNPFEIAFETTAGSDAASRS
jgi:hypothetical protein